MSERVVVLATGGTISSRSSARGTVATDQGADLVAGLARPGEVEVRDLLTVGSYLLTLADLRHIAAAVQAAVREPEVVGVVVTHGTDTLEESAYLLDAVHDSPEPTVLTGAMLPADQADSDGPRNLSAAIAVARSPQARGRGVLVTFAGRIWAARGVRKLHTSYLDAFGAVNTAGPIGQVDESAGGVQFSAYPQRPDPSPVPAPSFDRQRVDVVCSYPGADGRLLRAAVETGSTGIVLLGTGLGNANPDLLAAVSQAVAAGVPVVLSTRVPFGPAAGVYGNGGAVDLLAAGAILAPRLPYPQARIALALALATGTVDRLPAVL